MAARLGSGGYRLAFLHNRCLTCIHLTPHHMTMRRSSRTTWPLLLLLGWMFHLRLVGQHQVKVLEGFGMVLVEEGRPPSLIGCLPANIVAWHSHERHVFFTTSMDIPLDKIEAFSCFYQLDVVEVNQISSYQPWGAQWFYRERGIGDYAVDTVGIPAFQASRDALRPPGNVHWWFGDQQGWENSFRARVDFFACTLHVIYLEDRGYGDCDGNLRMIPQYAILPHPDNRTTYLCSELMPLFLKVPKPYFPWEH